MNATQVFPLRQRRALGLQIAEQPGHRHQVGQTSLGFGVFGQATGCQGLHQPASLSLDKEENVADVFWYPALVCIAGFILLFVALVLMRTATEIRLRRIRALETRMRS